MDYLAETVLRSVRDTATDEVEAWAFAVAFCSRKRPDLFPMPSPSAIALLGRGSLSDHRIYWQVMRHVLGDREVLSAIDGLKTFIEREGAGCVRVESSRLRLLLVAVATYASE